MTWIRFDPELTHSHGRANLVIFFAHSLACEACAAAIGEFVRLAPEFRARDAEVAVVLRDGDQAAAVNYRPVHMLIDPDGAARQQLGSLLEFDTSGKLLLVVLNVFAAPSAAWVGDDPGPEDELQQYALQRLDYISIQCPE